jgi:BatD DUF11 like domain
MSYFCFFIMKAYLRRILFCLLLSAAFPATAQLRFTATVSPAQIGKTDYAEIQFIVENAKEVQQIIPPDLNNFIVISGPNQASGMSSVNGVVKRYISISYTVKPRSTGNFTIGPATAEADGSKLRSNPVRLEVTQSSSVNNKSNGIVQPFAGFDPFEEARRNPAYNESVIRKGENPLDKIKNNIIVRAEVNKTSCYVGEPVIVTYKLYTRLKSESNPTKTPSFNGFSVVDLMLADNNNFSVEKLNGKEYNVYTLRKSQLYPLQSGVLELEPAEVENNVHFIKEAYAGNSIEDMFDGFGNMVAPPEAVENHKITLQSTPISINVKPLPENNKPESFRGAVGKYELSGVLEKDTFSTDDAGKFLLLLKGEGNLQMVNAPEVDWPKNAEVFEAKTTEDINKMDVPVSGRKLFEYPFTVLEAGNYTLPPVTLNYFDPGSGQYMATVTNPIHFTVIKGTGKPMDIIQTEGKKEHFFNRLFNERWIIVAGIAALIIIGLIIWLVKENKKDTENKKVISAILSQSPAVKEEQIEVVPKRFPLLQSEKCLERNDSTAFYRSLDIELKDHLAGLLQLPREDINKRNIGSLFGKTALPVDTVQQVLQLMTDVEWQLYTPVADAEKMQTHFDNAKQLLEKLENAGISYP